MYNEDGGSYPNLLGACAPFQIDGNFGCAAGIVELLMQSHDGELALLPALPDEWPSGSVRGLSARGGFIVDIRWRAGKLSEASVLSTAGGYLRLRAPGAVERLDGEALSPARGSNPNPCFFVTPPDDAGGNGNPEGFVYDIPTQAGQRIGFRALL
jgi:alpha-L-fucosidase 2